MLRREYSEIEYLDDRWQIFNIRIDDEDEIKCPYEIDLLFEKGYNFDLIVLQAADGDPAKYIDFCENLRLSDVYRVYGLMLFKNEDWSKH